MTGQSNLQILGQNSEAQEALKSIMSETFPALESEYNISDSVIAKFYDWFFPFPYTSDGGGLRRWQVSVRAWCGRNKKLDALEEFYNASGTAGTLTESYSGEDTTTVTDTQSIETTTSETDSSAGTDTETTEESFNPVNTASSKLSGKTTRTNPSSMTRARNNTETRTGKGGNVQTVYARGVSRTYSDGRTWTQIMNDIEAASAPVYSFINGFAQILIAPDDCYAPITCGVSMSATVGEVNTVPAGDAEVSVRNAGTPTNARFVFSFDVPQGVGIKSIKITEV